MHQFIRITGSFSFSSSNAIATINLPCLLLSFIVSPLNKLKYSKAGMLRSAIELSFFEDYATISSIKLPKQNYNRCKAIINSTDKSIGLDEFVSTDVVVNSIHVSNSQLIFMLINLGKQELERFGHLLLAGFIAILANALLAFWVADYRVACRAIVARQSEASGQESDRVFPNVDSSRLSDSIKPLSPLFISNSWRSECYDLDVFELFGGPDVNIADGSQSSSKTNAGNDESSGVNMFSKSLDDIVSDGSPHVVILLLHLAS